MTDPILGAVEPPTTPFTDQSNRDFSHAPLEVLEVDETIPPRPEEELADLERSVPDPH